MSRTIEEIEADINQSTADLIVVRNAQQVLDGEWGVLRDRRVELLRELAQAKKETTDAAETTN